MPKPSFANESQPIKSPKVTAMQPGWQWILGLALALACNLSSAANGLAHQVMSEGHSLAVWEKSPTNPSASILLVHGRTWSGRPDFDLQVPGEQLSLMDGLVAAGFAVYAVDLRGYGATPRDNTGWLSPNQAALDLAEVLSWVTQQRPNLGKPHLFGWSYGALVSQLTVQQQPTAAQTLLLFGYPLRPGISNSKGLGLGAPPAKPNTAANAASDFIVPNSISQAAIAGFVAAALAADPVRADWRELEQWQQLDPKRIAIPTLLLEAEFDPLALDDVHANFFSNLNISDKQWTRLPGGDHAAFMETPRAAFLEAMTSFMQRPR